MGKSDMLEMMRKLAEMSGDDDGDETQKKADALMDIVLDKEARVEAHTAIVRHGFLTIMSWIVHIMGREHLDTTPEALKHLKACMDIVLAHHQWIDTERMPSTGLMYTMRRVTSKASSDDEA